MSNLVENLISKTGLSPEILKQLASQVPQIDQALNLIGNPQEIVNVITDTAGNVLGERSVAATQELAKDIPLSMTFQGTIDSLVMFRNVSVIFIILWTILLVFNKYTSLTSQETKDNVQFINNTLIGNNGIISLIAFIWFFTLIIITLLPIFAQLEGIVPKIISVLAVFLGSK